MITFATVLVKPLGVGIIPCVLGPLAPADAVGGGAPLGGALGQLREYPGVHLEGVGAAAARVRRVSSAVSRPVGGV